MKEAGCDAALIEDRRLAFEAWFAREEPIEAVLECARRLMKRRQGNTWFDLPHQAELEFLIDIHATAKDFRAAQSRTLGHKRETNSASPSKKRRVDDHDMPSSSSSQRYENVPMGERPLCVSVVRPQSGECRFPACDRDERCPQPACRLAKHSAAKCPHFNQAVASAAKEARFAAVRAKQRVRDG